mmetsp:Transcript_27577/g.59900  ORF Transcript_27577/g.59900 Transcript_27577/m.59900 type:complete len:903 (-) Transcript_27577:125-2833(-)
MPYSGSSVARYGNWVPVSSTADKHAPAEKRERGPQEEVNKEIRTFLQEWAWKGLSSSDFDGRVRQTLYLVHSKKGIVGVQQALELLAEKRLSQKKIRNWPTYVSVLLTRYLEEKDREEELARNRPPEPTLEQTAPGSSASSVAGDTLGCDCDKNSQGDITTSSGSDSANSSASHNGDEDAASARSDPASSRAAPASRTAPGASQSMNSGHARGPSMSSSGLPPAPSREPELTDLKEITVPAAPALPARFEAGVPRATRSAPQQPTASKNQAPIPAGAVPGSSFSATVMAVCGPGGSSCRHPGVPPQHFFAMPTSSHSSRTAPQPSTATAPASAPLAAASAPTPYSPVSSSAPPSGAISSVGAAAAVSTADASARQPQCLPHHHHHHHHHHHQLPAHSGQAAAATPYLLLEQRVEDHGSNERFLHVLLSSMDNCVRESRPWQQQLVTMVEQACRHVLGDEFKQLALVGSVAMAVETPGSDVDVVVFTEHSVNVVGLLRKISEAVLLDSRRFGPNQQFEAKVLEDARVPILAISWNQRIRIDLAVNLQHSVDHVNWFSNLGVTHSAATPLRLSTRASTVVLRCLKWWLKQRAIPPAKEGGIPTIAWLLLALHATSSKKVDPDEQAQPPGGPERHEQQEEQQQIQQQQIQQQLQPQQQQQQQPLQQQPIASVLQMLRSVFETLAVDSNGDGFAGVLSFEADKKLSSFEKSRYDLHAARQPQLVIKDPESGLNLAPALSVATHLLIAEELTRGLAVLEKACEEGTLSVPKFFTPPVEFGNSIPTWTAHGFGALVVVDDNDSLNGASTVELVFVEAIKPRARWHAQFLHRADQHSKLSGHLLQRNVGANASPGTFVKGRALTFAPWNVVCCAAVSYFGRDVWSTAPAVVDRLGSMRTLLASMQANVS